MVEKSEEKNPGAAPEEGPREQDLIDVRKAKADKWRELGANPFGNGYRQEHLLGEIAEKYKDHDAPALEQANLTFTVAGRVILNRSFGKMAFLKLRDRSGELQV